MRLYHTSTFQAECRELAERYARDIGGPCFTIEQGEDGGFYADDVTRDAVYQIERELDIIRHLACETRTTAVTLHYRLHGAYPNKAGDVHHIQDDVTLCGRHPGTHNPLELPADLLRLKAAHHTVTHATPEVAYRHAAWLVLFGRHAQVYLIKEGGATHLFYHDDDVIHFVQNEPFPVETTRMTFDASANIIQTTRVTLQTTTTLVEM